jgi:RHS repeat-associated protein
MTFPKIVKAKLHRFIFHLSIIAFLLSYVETHAQTPIDLSRPVTSTDGVIAADGGGVSFTVPIKVPDGIKGISPQVTISYSSNGGGNGFTGHGWSLAPLSQISRAGKNYFHNGQSTPVEFTGGNDAFLLDGQRLMLISGTNGANGSVYGTENEQWSRIEAIGGDGHSPVSFKVTMKNGVILEYGTDNMKMLTDEGSRTIFWALRKVTDPNGNYVLYDYNFDQANRCYSLSSISYAGNSVNGTLPAYQVLFTYNTKTDWQTNPLYISGVTFNAARLLNRIDVRKADNTQIRSYSFSYQYTRKKYFLTSITEAGADGTTVNPITFTYGENANAAELQLTSEYGYSTNQNMIGDFDGDGRQDVQTYAYRYNTGNGETWFKWYQIYDYNAGSIGGKYTYSMETDIPYTDVKVMGNTTQTPFSVMDFDGDGKDDVFLSKFNQNSYNLTGVNINYSRVFSNGTSKYVDKKKMEYNSLPWSIYGTHSLWKQGGSFFTSGDFNGDGHGDYLLIVGINGYSNAYKAFLSTPSLNIFNQEILNFGVGVNGASGEWAANSVAEAKSLIPVNFNGDGKTELLVVRNEGSYVLRIYPIPASTGYSYASDVLHFTSEVKTDYKIFPGDFNGDGNTDLLVRASKNVSSTPWKIFYSTGKVYNGVSFVPVRTFILPGDGWSNGHMLAVGDYDGDGRSDIAHSIDDNSSSGTHYVYYIHGSTYEVQSSPLSSSTNSESMYSVGDFNGDGKPDFMKVRNASATSFYTRFLMLKPFKETSLLTGISNLGYLTSIDYGLLNNMDYSGIYSRTQGDYSYNDLSDYEPYIRPYMVPAPTTYAVAKISKPNGIGFHSNEYYTYQDAIMHADGRGFLGYARTDVRNDVGITKRVWNNVDLTWSLLYPDVTQESDNGGLISRSRITTTVQSLGTTYYDKRFFIKTDKVHSKNFLTNRGTEVTNTYDNSNGNITESVLVAGVSNELYAIPPSITTELERVTTNTIYNTSAGAPYAAFPTSVTISKTRVGQPAVSKTTTYSYTAEGLPGTITESAGTPIATSVTNTYNSFGLLILVNSSAPGVATPVSEYVYDPTGRYLLETKVSGGGITKKTTATYDDRWGLPLTSTTTDGLTTSYVYNNFGHLVQTNFPDGNSVITTKAWEVNSITMRMSTITQRTDGSNPVKAYYDILGREVKKEKRGFNNQWSTSNKFYDYRGLLYGETTPAYPGEQANTIWYQYDNYGRLTQVTAPNGTVTTTYSNAGGTTFTEQTTNAAGQTVSKTTDASGKVISSSDNGHVMDFTYDSWGNQLTASSGGQTFVTTVYDNYGRRSSTTDVNAGTTSYQYNAAGQLTQQTDASNNVQNITYDVFGRVLTKSGGQGTTTYTYYYDAGSNKSNNNVTQIVGFNGDVRTYQYDALQRISSEIITHSGNSLTKSYTYDSRGHLVTSTYPAGFLIRNIYDDNDIVIEKRYEQGATVKTLFAATAMNSRGTYTGYNTGNGKSKQVTWDYNKEVPTRFYTAGVQDLNMTYENVTLNMLSRNDAIKGVTEAFLYDADNRLINASVNGVSQFNITYDGGGQGKILQKTDVGNYNYDATKIHALQYLTPIHGGIDPATIFSGGVKNVTYTQFLKTASISYNNYEQAYNYGYDQERITSELKYGGVTVESKSYWGSIEGLVKGGNTYEIYYIAAGNGLNNIIVKQNGNISIYYTYTDHLGSIVAITDEAGNVIAEQNFDAWGRKRNPANWTYAGVPAVPDWLYRGFTGHEHVDALTLINMNGRMYDPYTGQMIAPDIYIPLAWSPAGYNRFNYGNSNPLKYTDPDGKFWWIVVGAVVGGFSGWQVGRAAGAKGWEMVAYIAGGTVIGAATGGIGSGVSSALGGGVAAGIAGGATGGALAGASFAIMGGADGNGVLKGAAFGALGGAISGGLGASGAFANWGYVGSGAATGLISGAVTGGLQSTIEGGNFFKGALRGALTGAAMGAASGLLTAGLSSAFGKGIRAHETQGGDDPGDRYTSNQELSDEFGDVITTAEAKLSTNVELASSDNLPPGADLNAAGSISVTDVDGSKSTASAITYHSNFFKSLFGATSQIRIAPSLKGADPLYRRMALGHEFVHAHHYKIGVMGVIDLEKSENAAYAYSYAFAKAYNLPSGLLELRLSFDYPRLYSWRWLVYLGVDMGITPTVPIK